jgi:UDP-N-acetylglucosamine:LPS N-acetylglucosamine transferase
MVAHGAAELVADPEVDEERFGDVVVGLLNDDVRRASMAAASRALGRRDAAGQVAALARRAASGSSSPGNDSPEDMSA